MNSLTIVFAFAIVGHSQETVKGASVGLRSLRTVSPCFQSPCKNNGRCYNTEEGYYCQCPEGYAGKRCEIPKCIDSDPSQCPTWANNGECLKNRNWMLKNCVKSCRVGACGCIEERKDCAVWPGQGECQRNPAYMMRFCRKSCGGCRANKVTVSLQ